MFKAEELRKTILMALRVSARSTGGEAEMPVVIDALENDPCIFVRHEAVDCLKELAARSMALMRDKRVEDALRKTLTMQNSYLKEQRRNGLCSPGETSFHRNLMRRLLAKIAKDRKSTTP